MIDAYQFEQAQDWVGIMIAPSALVCVPDLQKRCGLNDQFTVEAFREMEPRISWAAHIQPCRSIPFHTERPFETSSYDGFAVVPTSGAVEPAALRDSINQAIDKLSRLRAIAPTPGAQLKYQHAINWLVSVRLCWHQIAYFRAQETE